MVNAFASADNELLSGTGRNFLAGLIAHARAAAAFTTPTINGYKRYRSYSLAPRPRDLGPRQSWSHDQGARERRRWIGKARELGGRARGQSVSLHGLANRNRARRDEAHAGARAVRGYAIRDTGATSAQDTRGGSARITGRCVLRPTVLDAVSSTTICASRKPRSRATNPRSRTGSSGNISSSFRSVQRYFATCCR